jgi:hypothetical protein
MAYLLTTQRYVCHDPAMPLSIPTSGGLVYQADGMTCWPGFFKSFVQGYITRVRLNLSGFSHTYPKDMNLMLIKSDPIARRIRTGIMFADAIGNSSHYLDDASLMLDDAAAEALPQNAPGPPGPFGGGTYRPAQYSVSNEKLARSGWPNSTDLGGGIHIGNLPLPPAATGGFYTVGFSDFIGAPAYGCWSFWIYDDAGFDGGSIRNMELLVEAS